MNITEVLQLMETLLYKHEGKEFEDIHKEIVTGLWQHQSYRNIAEKMNYNPEYVGSISRELYQVLSKELKDLGEETEVKNSKFNTSIEKIANLYNSHFLQSHIINSHVTLCSNNPQNSPQDINNNQNSNHKKYHDLTFAPQILTFYDRPELETLNHYIFKQNIKLISVLGLSGIGKTYLVKKFVDLNLDQFEVIIWKNLKLTNDLSQIMTDILSKNLNDQDLTFYSDHQIDQFLTLLKTKRCLIIFDHLEELFIKEKLAGQFQEKFKNYQDLFNLIKEIDHQSHFILISNEKSKSLISLNQEVSNIKVLELEGLNNREILNNFKLQDQESWLKLIELYQGNFYYLKDIASLINDVFGGKVKDFLALNQLILTEDMKTHLSQILTRLSPIEKEIILKLSQHNEPISTEELTENLELELIDLINGLQSLQQRYLVTTKTEPKMLFNLEPIFQEYLKILT